jgi:hypothetical protein
MTADDQPERPYIVVDGFLPAPTAARMRRQAEFHLGDAYGHSPATHSNWDYWYVPNQYTYLRTLPEQIIGRELADHFRDAVDAWARTELGLGAIRHCYLSLYVDGCRQRPHNDATNGRFGFVYSLTSDQRRSAGGETLLWCADTRSRVRLPSSCSDFYDSVEPRFNRLLVFDDRLPHAVELVEGTMDPLDGRLVIHGHIRETGPFVSGGVSYDEALTVAQDIARAQAEELGDQVNRYHGVVTVRMSVGPDGAVGRAKLLVDRLVSVRRTSLDPRLVAERLLARVSGISFSPSNRPGVVTLPFGFG